MKQILQSMSSGESELVEAPAPGPRRGNLLIDTTRSLISSGTERMLVDFGKASLVAKAKSQPEKVRQVLDKVSTDGLMTTPSTPLPRLYRIPATTGSCPWPGLQVSAPNRRAKSSFCAS